MAVRQHDILSGINKELSEAYDEPVISFGCSTLFTSRIRVRVPHGLA